MGHICNISETSPLILSKTLASVQKYSFGTNIAAGFLMMWYNNEKIVWQLPAFVYISVKTLLLRSNTSPDQKFFSKPLFDFFLQPQQSFYHRL